MARGINKVILIGNLGADPEVRYAPSGAIVTHIRIATTEGWRDKQTGEVQERTEWHRIVFFNRLAEIAQQYLRKGAKVYIEGGLRTNKWQGPDGQDRYTTEIVAREMQMLDNRANASSPSDKSIYPENKVPENQPGTMEPTHSQPANLAEFDDDVPF